MTARGFLRGKVAVDVEHEQEQELIGPPPASPVLLPSPPIAGAMTGGMRMTGIGEIGAIAEAMNELPTQISS